MYVIITFALEMVYDQETLPFLFILFMLFASDFVFFGVNKEIIPVASHHDHTGEYPWELVKKAQYVDLILTFHNLDSIAFNFPYINAGGFFFFF